MLSTIYDRLMAFFGLCLAVWGIWWLLSHPGQVGAIIGAVKVLFITVGTAIFS